MKNIVVYYFLALILPVSVLLFALFSKNAIFFTGALLAFVLFRNYIDTLRLTQLGILKKGTKDYYYPLKSIRYFKELYFKR